MPFTNNPDIFEHPPPDQRLWRYLDFPKFVAMVQSGSFHFTRASAMSDPYEGQPPQAIIRALHGDQSAVQADVNGKPEPLNSLHLHTLLEMYMHQLGARDSMYLNCWTADDYENLALWRLYCEGSYGIAIKTTWERMVAGLNASSSTHNIIGGGVHYLDRSQFNTALGNTFNPYVQKSPHFQFEREVRFLFYDISHQLVRDGSSQRIDQSKPTPIGAAIQIDLEAVIDEIVVSPGSPPWFEATVKTLLASMKLRVDVRRSSIDDLPVEASELPALREAIVQQASDAVGSRESDASHFESEQKN